jgi:hypothetical protein
MKQSSFLSLNTKDFIKGLLLAVLTTVITIIYNSLQAGDLTFDWKSIGTTALTTALAYVMKNLLTNSNDQFLGKESK